MSSTALKERLLDMKQRYVQTMPERIGVITSTLADYVVWGAEVTNQLKRQFHTLAGTGGTYDLNKVAAAAFVGEEACIELNRSSPDGGHFAHLTFLVDQLRGVLAIDVSGGSHV